jgi:predicted permease
MLNDLRYALRVLRRSPGFALAATVSIALAIGANSAIFSMADALVLRPLAITEPSRVVTVVSRSKTARRAAPGLSYPDYVDLRSASRSFDGLVAYTLLPVGFAKNANAQPQLRMGMMVSGNFFATLGVEPQPGRGFRLEEDQVPGRDAVMVLAHELWVTEFGGDPAIVGRRVRLNGRDFDVVGIAPKSFTGMDQYVRPAFFVPLMMGQILGGAAQSDLHTNRQRRRLAVKGRLEDHVSIEAAAAETMGIFQSLERRHPDTNRGVSAAVLTEFQSRAEDNPYDLYLVGMLSFLVIVVLSIACGNVANLILSSARTRAREMGVRLALGAGRWRIVRQILTESMVIALAGGALGLLIAAYAVEMFATVEVPGDVPVVLAFEMNQRVLWFTFGVAVVTAAVIGLVPALHCTKTDLVTTLKDRDADHGARMIGRSLLVTLQVAGSLILVTSAFQLSRGLSNALTEDLGFRVDHRLTMRLDPSLAGYAPAQSEQFYTLLIERVPALAGVKSAALSSWIPNTTDGDNVTVIPEGFAFTPGEENATVFASTVDHSYFDTSGIRLLSGRGFLASDRAASPLVVVVNDAFARKYLGGNPIGKRIRLVSRENRWAEVVGVSAMVRQFNAIAPPVEFVYLPFSQHPQSRMTLIVETAVDPATIAAPLTALVHSLAPNVPVFRVRTMEDLFEQRSVKTVKMIVGTVVSVGLLGLSLALIGLYALVAYQVTRRTREIGIRMAIGAAQPQVLIMILRQAAIMGVAGVIIGALCSIGVAQGVTGAMGVPPVSPMLFGGVAASLLLATLLAAAIPARRASRIDPQEALRHD